MFIVIVTTVTKLKVTLTIIQISKSVLIIDKLF
jgi:hypothetical protein